MKKLFTILFILLVASPIFAEYENVSIYTNGYRWLEYSSAEKHLYIDFIRNKFNIDNVKYPTRKIMATLDHLYDLAAHDQQRDDLDRLLILPCTVILSGFIDALNEEAEKYKKII